MKLRVLVVDDTVVYRRILSDVLATLPGVEVAGTAASGELALRKLEQKTYDLVLMDIQMPGLDGVQTLKRINQQFPEVLVVMISSATERGSEIVIEALNEGALDFVRKPHGETPEENARQLAEDLGAIMRVSETRLVANRLRRANAGESRAVAGGGTIAAPPTPEVRPQPKPVVVPKIISPIQFGILAIGSSTGGPVALTRVIPLLPGDFALPVVIVQHMPPVFTGALANDLNRKSHLTVKEAEQDDPVVPGMVLIAPGGRHIVVRNTSGAPVIRLDDGPPENSCKPSVGVLFHSVAQTYGTIGVLAAVLTGMGADGKKGVAALKERNCFCLTQSEQSCVVYGMPQAVDEAGLSNESCDIEDLASRIVSRVREGRR